MDNIVDGKKIANDLFEKLKKEIKNKKLSSKPTLAILQVGKNLESDLYVKNKKNLAEELGFIIEHYKFDSDITTNKIIGRIKELNHDDTVNGIMIQLPLPKHLSKRKILNSICLEKDVDGLNKKNQKLIAKKKEYFISPTALSVWEILQIHKIDVKEKNILVIGRGIVAGKPISLLLRANGSYLKIITKKNKSKMEEYIQWADIIISAVGQENLITKNIVPRGKVLIDVGTKIVNDNRLVGDLDFAKLKDDALLITPTPGGVGVITVIFLMKNLWKASIQSKK